MKTMIKAMMKAKMFWLIVAVIVVLIVGAVMIAQNGLQVEITTVTVQTIEDNVTEKGVVEAGVSISQMAQVSGTVQQLFVKENQEVKKGDVLFSIDATDANRALAIQQNTLDSYEAQLESASHQYNIAEQLYQKQKELYAVGGISALELENSEATYLTAAAQMQQAQSAVEGQKQVLQQLTASLDHYTVTAVSDGILTALPAAHLTAVQAGQEVATLLNTQRLTAVFDLLYSEVPLLQLGDPVTLTVRLRSGDIALTGTIIQINDFAQAEVSALGLEEYRVKVTVAIDSTDDSILKDGYEVQGKFQLYRAEDTLAVPNSALYKVDDNWYVFAVRDGVAVKTPVEIGYQAVSMTEIKAGLIEGEQIIKNANTEGLEDGVKVK